MSGWRGTYFKGKRKGAPTVGIRDRLAAHDSRLVSVSELLTAITNAEGVTPQEVVRALYIDEIPTSVPIWMLHYNSDTYRKGGDDGLIYELECAANGGKAWLSPDAEGDLYNGKPGFLREELVAALKAAGWSVPSCLIKTEARDKGCNLLPFVPRVNISLSEAASLLTEANGGDWREALEDAADTGQIQAMTWSMDRGEQLLSHVDIRAWCEAAGAEWPVPLPPGSAPSTDEGLREALAESQTREAAALAERDAYQAEADRLRDEVERLRTENAALRDAGRSESAALPAKINSDTLDALTRAIEAFPSQYPDRAKKIKLDADLRIWLAKEFSFKTREQLVFSNIISEHFTPEGWDIGS